MPTLQFGEKIDNPLERLSVYGVIVNDKKEILVVNVRGKYHLPGGGIDEGEDGQRALRREVLEETGYEIMDLRFVGKANQFLPNASVGPMNKLGTFYSAHIDGLVTAKSADLDHVPEWIDYNKLMESTMSEFQKWAVAQVFDYAKTT
ncbi:TPA: hypothetical protein DEP96_02645 [Candidatus Uhrbacteria bacterium]|nr:hypothetical protein [Candidatus Uhrbacteria bacterium]